MVGKDGYKGQIKPDSEISYRRIKEEFQIIDDYGNILDKISMVDHSPYVLCLDVFLMGFEIGRELERCKSRED